jgi:maltooligosyltrehalose synthase
VTIPRATYRLQLREGFGFSQVAGIAPYLARLGVSHVYLSPIFKARPGSVHGYDITDHDQLNPELGTEAEFKTMVETLRREGIGRVLDFVPNHMGVWGADIRCGSTSWSGVRNLNTPAGSILIGRLSKVSCSRPCSARSMAKN